MERKLQNIYVTYYKLIILQANNLSEGIHKIKCKLGCNDKKWETYGIKYKLSNSFLEYINFKDDLMEYKFLCCNKNFQQNSDEKLKERFFNTFKFYSHDNNKFGLLLCRDVDPYQHMDGWEKFYEESLPEKEKFYSHLNIEDIIDADYAHTKSLCKGLEIKNLGEYHDLYIQRDTLLLADVFEKFRNICLKIFELDPAKFLLASGLAWQAALKKAKVNLDLLSDINMLLMAEKI